MVHVSGTLERMAGGLSSMELQTGESTCGLSRVAVSGQLDVHGVSGLWEGVCQWTRKILYGLMWPRCETHIMSLLPYTIGWSSYKSLQISGHRLCLLMGEIAKNVWLYFEIIISHIDTFFYSPKSQDLYINRKTVPDRKTSKFTFFSNFLPSEVTSLYLLQFPDLQ